MAFEPLRVLEVPEQEPFKHDALRLKGTAEKLTALLLRSTGPTTMAIDGPWGCGKSTFVRMWVAEMARLRAIDPTKAPRVVAFNAWATQGYAPPLAALLGEVERQLEPERSGDQSLIDAARALKSKALVLGKAMLPTVLKGAAERFIGEGAAADLAEKMAEAGVADWRERQQSAEDFRKKLTMLAARVGGGHPLIIVVDELDRCRPTYAIEFLETLEHLFGVRGIVFVVALNKEQLGHAVRGVYGDRFEGDAYLRRFIDVEYSLPAPPLDDYVSVIFRATGLEELLRDAGAAADAMVSVARVFSLSIRDVNQIVHRLKFVAHQGETIFPELTLLLLALRMCEPTLYSEIGSLMPRECLTRLASARRNPALVDSRFGQMIEGILLLAHARTLDREAHDRLVQGYKESELERERAIYAFYSRHGNVARLEDYLERVELAGQFRFRD